MDASNFIMMIFELIFGGWVSGIFGGGEGGAANFSILSELFAYANIFAMAFASIITGLFAFGGGVNAATKGSVMGERWNGAGSVISMAVAAGMILPINLSMFGGSDNYKGQVSGAQYTVLKTASLASDLTEEVYTVGVNSFVSNGFNSSFSEGNVDAALSLTRAHACTIAGVDNWEQGSGGDEVEERQIIEERPYKSKYVVVYSANEGSTASRRASVNSIDELRGLIRGDSINTATAGVTQIGRELVTTNFYVSSVLFGGQDGVCGRISIPTTDYGLADTPNSDPTDMGEVISLSEERLAKAMQRKIRKLYADLIFDTYEPAKFLMAYSTNQMSSETAALRVYNVIEQKHDTELDNEIDIIDSIATQIFDAGGRFYRGVDDATSDGLLNDDSIKNAMLQKGWPSAGTWVLQMSRFTNIPNTIKGETVGAEASKGTQDLCVGFSFWDSLFMSDEEMSCDAKQFMNFSWTFFSPYAVNSFANNKLTVSQDANYYLRRSATSKAGCSEVDFNENSCGKSLFNDAFYISDLLVDYIWDDPSSKGISNPPEPMTYIAGVGDRMLSAAATVTILSAIPMASYNFSKKSNNTLINIKSSFLLVLLEPFIMLVKLVITTLYVSGYLLSFVMPMIPVIHWLMYVFSWVITVVIGYVALPIALAMIIIPTEQGFTSAKKQRVIHIIAAIFFKPVLGLFGLFASLLLLKVGLGIFNELYWDALAVKAHATREASVGYVVSLMIQPLAIFLIATASIIGLIRHSFKTLNTLPSEVLKTLDVYSDRVFGDEVEHDTWSNSESKIGSAFEALGQTKATKGK
jgi:conjugal transfer/type IV secretion protein DotA/TraY